MSASSAELGATWRRVAGVSVVEVAGELDLSCEQELQTALAAAWERSAGCLVADLSGVAFADVRGLDVLLHLARRARGEGGVFVIAAPPPPLVRMTAALHLPEALRSYPTLTLALDAVARESGGNR